MKILALDSTALTASVALCDGGVLTSLWTLNNKLTHSETLLPMIETMLAAAGMTVGDINIFACATGPGSFTGVRIGAATIKGLAFGRDTPCIGVSTLEALARNLTIADGIICPVMNARRNQVYNALFECKNGKLTRLCPDRAVSLDALELELAEYERKDKKIYLSGDGYEMTRSALTRVSLCETPQMLIYQNAFSVALCALDMYNSGIRTTAAELSPIYLRLPQAERERLERLQEP